MPGEWRPSSPEARQARRSAAFQQLLAGKYSETAQRLAESGLYEPSAHSLGRLADMVCTLCCLSERGSVRVGNLVECTGPVPSSAMRLLDALDTVGELQEVQGGRAIGEPHPYEVVAGGALDQAVRDFSVDDLCFQRHSGK